MLNLRGEYLYLTPMTPDKNKLKIELDNDFFPVLDSLNKQRTSYYPTIELSATDAAPVVDIPLVSNDSTFLLEEVIVTAKAGRVYRDKVMGRLDSLAQRNFGPWVCIHGYLENYREGYSHLKGHPAVQCAMVEHDTITVRRIPVIGKVYPIIKYEPVGSNGLYIVTDKQTVEYKGPYYSEEELLRMNNIWRTKGYYANMEFQQPDELDMKLSMPDARNTLLWSPQVVTDEKGEAEVSFYCSDINTQFVVKAEGVDGGGLLGDGEWTFRVMRNLVVSVNDKLYR
jgi:hypothetical protein